ncbi:Glycosyltransferase 1 domain-containing protein 1 [Triplophysa tibetana]|uniref:Glycosyltransferase 1 domain-containing protein 1 n=1 Tax=Triplophysa tibetana TaxID=1572043 RepID=A0A5A9NVF7_9TELE|nr:Glycosyltransferase 1 domain-containing protein 1 [Triplophysa tibetana]
MRVLFLACLSPKTGNCTTAERIRDHIIAAGHSCVLCDTRELGSASDVTSVMTKAPGFEAALAIHLFKGGRLLLDTGVPFGVVFGGTDVNEDVMDEHKRAAMERVMHKARHCSEISQPKPRQLYQSRLSDLLPCRVYAAVDDGIAEMSALDHSGVCGEHRWEVCSCVSTEKVEDLRVFLLVCGLRRVKDPLYLLEAFSEWHIQNPLVILIIIGPKIDPVFTVEVEERVNRSAGVFLADELSKEELHAAMQKSFTLVNSSLSEGMSAAILEAMDLGLPVLARDIPGNGAIIKHEVTGLLYTTPQEFVSISKKLLEDLELQERVVKNGKNYIKTCHNLMEERMTYQHLVESLH